MSHDLITIPSRSQLTRAGLDRLPVVVARAGEKAAWRFVEFFTANIRNKSTRAAYAQACSRFFEWCNERGLRLEQLQPVIVASYIETLQNSLSGPSVKQHLAAIRMLFDWLILGQIIPMNPAAAVRRTQDRNAPLIVHGGGWVRGARRLGVKPLVAFL